MAAHLETVPLVDTHQHIVPEEEWLAAPTDFFAWFPHYASSDLVSAGMPIPVLEEIRDPRLPLEQRWARLAPYWEATPTFSPRRGEWTTS